MKGVANERKEGIGHDVKHQPLAPMKLWGQRVNHRLDSITLLDILTNRVLAVQNLDAKRKLAGCTWERNSPIALGFSSTNTMRHVQKSGMASIKPSHSSQTTEIAQGKRDGDFKSS